MATIYKDATFGEVLNWTLLDDKGSATPWVDSGEVDFSNAGLLNLHISMAQCNTTAIATEAVMKVWGKSGTTHDDWHLITQGGYGTIPSGKIDMSKGITSGEYSCGIGDTTGCETWGQRVFLQHATLANSMVNVLRDWSNDGPLFFLNPATVDFTSTGDVLCPTGGVSPGVAQWNVEIPDGFQVAKVTFHNPDDDANYACRVQWTKVMDYSVA